MNSVYAGRMFADGAYWIVYTFYVYGGKFYNFDTRAHYYPSGTTQMGGKLKAGF